MMNNRLKYSLLKVLCLSLLWCGMATDVWAATQMDKINTNGHVSKEARNCSNIDAMKKDIQRLKDLKATAPKATQSDIDKTVEDYNEFLKQCALIKSHFPNIELDTKGALWWEESNQEYNQRIEKALEYLSKNANSDKQKQNAATLLKNLKTCNYNIATSYNKIFDNYEKTGGKTCGEKYPFGCPSGQKCWKYHTSGTVTMVGATTPQTNYMESTNWECSATNPGEKRTFDSPKNWEEKTEGSKGEGSSSRVSGTMGFGTTDYNKQVQSDGSSKTDDSYHTLWTGDGGEVTNVDRDGNVTFYNKVNVRTNESCHIDQLYETYMDSCYSCVIVSALINTFMQVADKLAPVMQTAGIRLLILGIPIWLAFYILQKIVSLVSLEPMEILNDLFRFFFKCVLAYVLISSGVRAVSQLMVNPVLNAGADYGIGIIDSVMPKNIDETITGKLDKDNKLYKLAAKGNVDEKVFDKIMLISKKADAAVSLNFVIGNALFCHSHHAGAHLLSEKLSEYLSIRIYIPDFWLMLCGILIWCFAFMVTIGVNFYLLDISFKVGFALLALPVTMGLWPFEKFKDKFTTCFKIIVNAAGTFMFLGISTGMSIALISASLRGTDTLLDKIKNGVEANNQEYISQVFGFTGAAFILVFFAFFYSHKLISETVGKLADKFFSSVMSGMSPMNQLSTQVLDVASNLAKRPAKGLYNATVGKAVNAAKAGAKSVALAAGRGGVKGLRSAASAIGRATSRK